MSMPYAIIQGTSGVCPVVNIISWDGTNPYTPPVGCTTIQCNSAGIGYLYNFSTMTFTAPPPPQVFPTAAQISENYSARLQGQAALLTRQGKTAKATALMIKSLGV